MSDTAPTRHRRLLPHVQTWLLLAIGLAVLGIVSARLLGLSSAAECWLWAGLATVLLGCYLREQRARLRLLAAQEALHASHRAFVSTVSHDVRTPLTAILGFGQLLCDDEPVEEERQRRYLQTIRTQSEHLARMIEDIVDLARLADGSLGFKPSPVRAAETIENALMLYTSSAERARLRLEIAPDTPPFQCDRFECEQVLDRFLHLALRVTPPDAPSPPTLTVARHGDEVRFSLHLPEARPEDAPLRPLCGEAGPLTLARVGDRNLELTVARALIEAQEGRVWVTAAEQAGGTVVGFAFPVASPEAETTTRPAPLVRD